MRLPIAALAALLIVSAASDDVSALKLSVRADAPLTQHAHLYDDNGVALRQLPPQFFGTAEMRAALEKTKILYFLPRPVKLSPVQLQDIAENRAMSEAARADINTVEALLRNFGLGKYNSTNNFLKRPLHTAVKNARLLGKDPKELEQARTLEELEQLVARWKRENTPGAKAKRPNLSKQVFQPSGSAARSDAKNLNAIMRL